MIKRILSLILLTAPFFVLGQQEDKFECPIKKGKIIHEERGFHDGKRNPGAVFEGKNDYVYSCSSGLINSIDTTNNITKIHIESGIYFFSYYDLEKSFVKKGDVIKKGQLIGKVKKGKRLFLICSKNKELIEPESILKCKVITRNLE